MSAPWPHQIAHRDHHLALWAQGRGAANFSDMGAGKSRTAIECLNETRPRRTLILAPKSVASGVWAGQLEQFATFDPIVTELASGPVKERMAQIKKALTWNHPVTAIVNYEAIPLGNKFGEMLAATEWDALICDECFPAGTAVDTPAGTVPIEALREGDAVWGERDGIVVPTRVRSTFSRAFVGDLVQVNGVAMTPEHPVWTQEVGYVKALDAAGLTVIKSPCAIQEPASISGALQGVRSLLYGPEGKCGVLRQEVFRTLAYAESPRLSGEGARGNESDTFAPRGTSQARAAFIGSDQSIQRSAGSAEVSDRITRAGIRAPQWGKREAAFSSAATISSAAGVGHRGRGEDRYAHQGQAASLQDRYRGPGVKDRNRGGRAISRNLAGAGRGCAEGFLAPRSWLARAEVQESRSDERPGRSGEHGPRRRTVYNLETETGNYFAGGLLVHNCHRMKAPAGKQSRMVAKIASGIPHRLELTGTPISGADGPLGIYAQYRAIEPRVYSTGGVPWTFTSFKARYTRPARWGSHDGVTSMRAGILQPWAWHNLDDLKARMWSIATRVETADVIDLPDHVDLQRVCELEPEARRFYRKLERDLIADIADGTVTAANALVRILRLQQTTGGVVTDDDGVERRVSHAKARALADLLEDIDPTEPVAVFGRFHADLDAIRAVSQMAHRPYLEISGRMNQYADWGRRNGESHGTAPLIAVQIQAGGLGISLVQARYCVFYSLSHSLAEYDQARARVLRPGQGRNVTYVHLVAQGTIDGAIYRALEKRENVVHSVIGGLR